MFLAVGGLGLAAGVDRTATPDRRIMIVDSFGQRAKMGVDQFRKLAAEGVSDRFQTLANL